ncbi:MAG: C-terminal binding protein, partial [Anaerolineae bacterium]
MSRPLVVVTDTVFPSLEPTEQVLAALDAQVTLIPEPTAEAILEAARTADGIVVTYAKVTAEIINGLERCKVISRTGIGVDNVDIDAATARGIVVTRVPDYCIDEVSDHALGLLFALARKIPLANSAVHAGQWSVGLVNPLH